MARIDPKEHGAELCAFLDLIAFSEIGPGLLAVSDDGYNVVVGSTPTAPHLFKSYAKHPEIYVTVKSHDNEGESITVRSSAAGRYEFIVPTWVPIRDRLKLADFGPVSQDLAAKELLRECGALPYVETGRIELAIVIAKSKWASFPGAGYGQPEHKIVSLLSAYNAAIPKYQAPNFANVTAGIESTAPKVNP